MPDINLIKYYCVEYILDQCISTYQLHDSKIGSSYRHLTEQLCSHTKKLKSRPLCMNTTLSTVFPHGLYLLTNIPKPVKRLQNQEQNLLHQCYVYFGWWVRRCFYSACSNLKEYAHCKWFWFECSTQVKLFNWLNVCVCIVKYISKIVFKYMPNDWEWVYYLHMTLDGKTKVFLKIFGSFNRKVWHNLLLFIILLLPNSSVQPGAAQTLYLILWLGCLDFKPEPYLFYISIFNVS